MGLPIPRPVGAADSSSTLDATLVVCIDTTELMELWYCLVPNQVVSDDLDDLIERCDGKASSFYTSNAELHTLECMLSDLAAKGVAYMAEGCSGVVVPDTHRITRMCTVWYV